MEEAQGLHALAGTNKIRCVKVLAADEYSITLENIKTETPTAKFWQRFGRELAELHSVPQDYYGFEIHNHIGATEQSNPKVAVTKISWADYFVQHRLKYLLKHPRLSSQPELHMKFDQAEPNLKKCLLQVTENPCLVHGDLWSGNFLCTEGQIPVLIDPATYSGHREVDLAMTELFGGFDEDFYKSYDEHLPLKPGYEQRKHIYNLYHILNHWILFGGSYANQALSTLERTINLK